MNTPHAPIDRYFRVNRLTPGRAALVARQIIELAGRLADPMLVELAIRLLEAATRYDRIGNRRRRQETLRGDGTAREIDNRVDGNIVGLATQLDVVQRDFKDDPLGRKAGELKRALLPDGPGAITALPYEDELHAVDRLVEMLGAEDPAVLERMNVLYYLERLRALLPEYSAALALRRRVSATEVKAAREHMHRALCGLIGYAVARWYSDAELAVRNEVMAVIDDQQDRVSALMRARRLGRRGAAGELPPEDAARQAEEAEVDAALDEDFAADAADGLTLDDAAAPVEEAAAPIAEAPPGEG